MRRGGKKRGAKASVVLSTALAPQIRPGTCPESATHFDDTGCGYGTDDRHDSGSRNATTTSTHVTDHSDDTGLRTG